MSAALNLVGQRYGRWLVLELDQQRTKGHSRFWLCRCDCGTVRSVWIGNLRNGTSQNCGCVHRTAHRVHGGRYRPEYRIWLSMKDRCVNPRCKSYANYGGRGITVCPRWMTSFADFFADMGARPSPKHSLERKDNDGPYCPENCVWALLDQQANNRRGNRRITYQGRTQTAAEWARELGLKYDTVLLRLSKGWPADRVLDSPAVRQITYRGRTLTLREWAAEMNIPWETLRKRLRTPGWTIEDALTRPMRFRKKVS